MTHAGSNRAPGLDLANGRLWSLGREVPLTPTSFSMLRYFVLHPDRLITKQELLDQIWPDTHVEDSSVKDYVRKIRRLLGDDPQRPRFIETTRGLGYRYLGGIDVSGLQEEAPAVVRTHDGAPRLAVLPFADESRGTDQAHFSDGIAEGIIAELTRFRSLVVVARDSSFLYGTAPVAIDRVARELDVQYIVRGTVRKAGASLRIHAELIDAATGAYLWAEHYDRNLTDIFAMQDDVGTAIVSTLVGRLEALGRQRVAQMKPEKLQTYECLLLGEHHLRQETKEGILTAREMFQRAIVLEPASARAHADLALSYLAEFWSDWTTSASAAVDKAFALAGQAVAMDELDSRAHIYLATAYYYGQSNFELAEVEFDKALALNPNDYDGYCLRSWLLALSGRADEGIVCAEQAIKLSPLTTEDCRVAQFCAAYTARRYDEAIMALKNIPGPSNLTKALLAAAFAQLERDAEARRMIARYVEVAREEIDDFPGDDGERWRQYWTIRYPFRNPADLEHLLDGLQKAGLPLAANNA